MEALSGSEERRIAAGSSGGAGEPLADPGRREPRQAGTGGRQPLPAYLTVRQACEVAGIGRTTFYRLLANPRSGLANIVVRLPVIGHMRIPEREFREWLERPRTKRAARKMKNPT